MIPKATAEKAVQKAARSWFPHSSTRIFSRGLLRYPTTPAPIVREVSVPITNTVVAFIVILLCQTILYAQKQCEQKHSPGFLLQFRSHTQQFPNCACGQTFHVVVQFGDGFEEPCHGRQPLASVIRARFFRVEVGQTLAKHLARMVALA